MMRNLPTVDIRMLLVGYKLETTTDKNGKIIILKLIMLMITINN